MLPRAAFRSARLRWLYTTSAVTLLAALGPAPAPAQTSATGALGGVLLDPTGSAIPHARIHIASRDSSSDATTDSLGEFLLNNLPPGDYALQASANGFDTLTVAHIAVPLGSTVRIAPHLAIAAQMQTIQVETTSEQPRFDSPLDANLSPTELADLPLDGRRFQNLAVLAPLATLDDAPADDGTPTDTDNARISVRGRHPQHNGYRLDGLSLTRAFDGEPRGGRDIPFTLAMEGIREFQLRVADASSGHDEAGSINTVTRRGERQFHGSAFASLRNSGVGASNPFAYAVSYNNGAPTTTAVKPQDTRIQFGGSAGGPLARGVYGFVSAEGQRRSFPGIASPSDPNFFSLTPTQRALLANRGVNAAAIGRALTFLDGLGGRVDRRADELSLFPRIDIEPTRSTTLTAEWAHTRFRSPAGQHTAPVEPRGRASFGNLATHSDTAIVFGTAALSTRWLVDIRAQYSRDASFAEVPAPLPSEPQTGPGGAAPQVSIAGDFTFGNANSLGARRLPDERRTETTARLIFTGAAHTVSLGFDVSGIDERLSGRDGSSGAYTYTSGSTGGFAGGLVDFITDATFSSTAYPNGGCPSVFAAVHYFCFRSFTQTFGTAPATRFHTVDWGFFAGDSWRLTPHLQGVLGVRYHYTRLPPSQQPNAALDAVFGSFASSSNTPRDTNNLAPHAGVAYAPDSRTVVRIGYSVHFGAVPGRTLQAALENTATRSSQTTLRITPRTIIDPACASAGTNFGYPATYTCTPFGPLASLSAATVFARGFQLPVAQIAELSITRDLSERDSITASYILGLDRQLQNTTDLNIAPSTSRVAFRIVRNGGEPGVRGGDVFNVPRYTSRRTSAFGAVTGILSNGNATYHALAVQLQHRASRSLMARLAWTYSKSLDNVRSPSALPNENAQFDPADPLYDRAPSNFDRTHRIVAAASWQPHIFRSGTTGVILNGWSIAPLVLLSSGRPYSYNIVADTSLTGGRDSLNSSGGAAYVPSVGANTLRLPWTQNIDLRITRAIPLHDTLRLRATAEAFNLFNHVNINTVQQRAFLAGTPDSAGIVPLVFQDAATIAAQGITARPFGTPTGSAESPTRERRIQFGLRLDW